MSVDLEVCARVRYVLSYPMIQEKEKCRPECSQLVELSCSGYWETGISTLTGSS